eukprot:3060635-Amphidinium_carterae.1
MVYWSDNGGIVPSSGMRTLTALKAEESRTSRTLSENHTTRPNSQIHREASSLSMTHKTDS